MKLTFIYNACMIVEQDGKRLLTDPWLTPGAFEGSWYQYPPLKTTPAALADVDYLYISHLHPDHFDPVALAQFRRDITLVVLDHGRNFLARRLSSMGFTNVLGVGDGQTAKVGPFTLTLFAPFTSHPFHERLIGNLLDSAIVIEAAGKSILNTNDNALTPTEAAKLRDRFGRISVAQLNYNAAGPYPACFANLSQADKYREHDRILVRNIGHLVEVAKVLQPDWVMPFAGAYVIGGALSHKNAYLGTTTWDDAAQRIRQIDPSLGTLVMHEGLVFDLAAEAFENGPYRPIDLEEQSRYIETELAQLPYPHEFEMSGAEMAELARWVLQWLPKAREHLWGAQQKLGFTQTCNIYLSLPDVQACIAFDSPAMKIFDDAANVEAPQTPYLKIDLDLRLLARILATSAHWNSAQIGCHIEFWREPNIYMADVDTLLSFLHIPPSHLDLAMAELSGPLRVRLKDGRQIQSCAADHRSVVPA